MSTDVSEFFSQLENPDVDDSVGAALSNFLQQAESSKSLTSGRFHPYESSSSSRPSSTAYSSNNDDVLMEAAAASPLGGYQTSYSGQNQFADSGSSGLLYQNAGGSDGYGFSGGSGTDLAGGPDQSSGEDIWDLDSHTVRRYNPPPLPDPVSPGPIPTTPTMYGLQGSKAGWEPAPYPQYTTLMSGNSRAAGGQVSPGIGGPWIGGTALPLKAPSLMGGGGAVAGAADVSKRPKSYQCEACDKWFTSSGHLKRHFNTTLHKNAMKQKGGGGDGYLDGGLSGGGSGSYSIPSVESRGPPSPCMSLGGEEESSQSCDEASSQSSQVSLTPAGTPGPFQQQQQHQSLQQRQPPLPAISPPLSASSPYVPNVSPSQQNNNHHHHLLSPPPSSVGVSDSASSPLSGLSQLVGQPPSTPQPPTAMSPLTPGMSPNGNLAGSPARNRYSPFRSGGGPLTTLTSANHSYKVQSLDMRGYSTTTGYSTAAATFQQVSSSSSPAYSNGGGDVYSLAASPQSAAYRSSGGDSYSTSSTTYTGQYQAQYQPLLYNTSSYAMVGASSSSSHQQHHAHHPHQHHQSYLGMSQ
jgi:Zinc-finger double-stranded RNA-binding